MILADEQLTGATGPGGELLAGNVLWALTDHLGSVRDLVAFEDTNNDTIKDTAVIKNHIKYNAFGEIVSESDPTVEHIFGFTGRERDKESDLYYYRNRYYDPTTGRFITADPVRDDFENTYRYVNNDPVNRTDPSGLMAIVPSILTEVAMTANVSIISQKSKNKRLNPIITKQDMYDLAARNLALMHMELINRNVKMMKDYRLNTTLTKTFLWMEWDTHKFRWEETLTSLSKHQHSSIAKHLIKASNYIEKGELEKSEKHLAIAQKKIITIDTYYHIIGVSMHSLHSDNPALKGPGMTNRVIPHAKWLALMLDVIGTNKEKKYNFEKIIKRSQKEVANYYKFDRQGRFIQKYGYMAASVLGVAKGITLIGQGIMRGGFAINLKNLIPKGQPPLALAGGGSLAVSSSGQILVINAQVIKGGASVIYGGGLLNASSASSLGDPQNALFFSRAQNSGGGANKFRGEAAKGFNWEHILDRHSTRGRTARHRNRPDQVFGDRSDNEIMAIIKSAWKKRKKMKTQNDPNGIERILFEGVDDVSKVRVKMWFNRSTKIVETAYPVP